jgi:hypothetical protein
MVVHGLGGHSSWSYVTSPVGLRSPLDSVSPEAERPGQKALLLTFFGEHPCPYG